jgi:hypothetical protein
MQITHDEARWLIESDIDRALNSEKQKALTAHLQECEACRLHAVEMKDVENTLRDVMHKHWSYRPLPLSMDSIKIHAKNINSLYAWRLSLVSVAMFTFLFLIWGIKITAFNSPDPLPLGSLAVPTPSFQLTTASAISAIFTRCDSIIYEVQEFDTLNNIADQFFVSREEIMALNNMRSDRVYKSMKLEIPQCNITPTGVADTPTTTLTPNFQLTIFTP